VVLAETGMMYTSSVSTVEIGAEEVLFLKVEFTPLNGWLDQFRKCAGLSYRTMSGESKV
jgi:hypothetical protein